MPRKQRTEDGRVLLVDSITQLTAADAGTWVVAGSHGGSSSASYALEHPLALVVFNDAGGGKDNAGTAALEMLHGHGVAAAAVAHTSGRIGDSLDMWENGVLSQVNPEARQLGLKNGDKVSVALSRLVQ